MAVPHKVSKLRAPTNPKAQEALGCRIYGNRLFWHMLGIGPRGFLEAPFVSTFGPLRLPKPEDVEPKGLPDAKTFYRGLKPKAGNFDSDEKGHL